MNETPYVEANLVLAEQVQDTAAVDEMIADLHPSERQELAEVCDRLASKLRIKDGVIGW